MNSIKRILFYLLKGIAFFSRIAGRRSLYMSIVKKAYEITGVVFTGTPRYIHHNAFLDGAGGLTIGNNIVISTDVIILTHDYSYTTGLESIGKRPPTDLAIIAPVSIGNNCFLGARSTLLPGTTIGNNVIVGAGSVVKGTVPDNTIVAGNPARPAGKTDEWIEEYERKHSGYSLYTDKR
jgi:acetyltransferase-like isoleucine patch superfamily enzyme